MKEASTENTIKGISEIHSRLFNHRPVLNNEIKYFLREFETKRNNQEQQSLERCLKTVKKVNEEIVPDVLETLEKRIPDLVLQLSAATKMAQTIEAEEEKRMQTLPLEDKRKDRQRRWNEYLEKLAKERDKVDIEHALKVQEIDQHFVKLDETLSSS